MKQYLWSCNGYFIESMGKDLVGVTLNNSADPHKSCGVNMSPDVLNRFIRDLQSFLPENDTEDLILSTGCNINARTHTTECQCF